MAALPVDRTSADRLAADGLRLGLVDTADPESFGAWVQAELRGFHHPAPTEERLAAVLQSSAGRRTTAVWDDESDPAVPVATLSGWEAPLSLPGGLTAPAWAISAVTVAPTHRRRGIARALLEGELRTADQTGMPLAVLTVSEATIYSRYGFGLAAFARHLTIDARRARFTGPHASGRLRFVSPQQLHETGRQVFERARLRHPGEIELDDHLWRDLCGVDGAADEQRGLRVVRDDDESGTMQGFAVYRMAETPDQQDRHVCEVLHLTAATDDAYAGLWRFLLELDLITELSAGMRSSDEPVLWQLSDYRAARVTANRDHLWVRVLDVPRALEARRYAAPGRVALDVSDPLGYAHGKVLVVVDASGRATVSPCPGDAPAGVAELALGAPEIGSLYLGGVSAVTLARAGRVTELRPGSASAFDAVFHSPTAPWLSVWF